MSEQSATFTLILGELVLILLILVGGMVTYFLLNLRKRSRSLTTLLKLIQDTKTERVEQINAAISKQVDNKESNSMDVSSTIQNLEENLTKEIVEATYRNKSTLANDLGDIIKGYTDALLGSLPNISRESTAVAPEIERDTIPDIDDAIDELMDDDNTTEADPAFDLSTVDSEGAGPVESENKP